MVSKMIKFYIMAMVLYNLTQTNCQENSVLDELFLPIVRDFQISMGKMFRDFEPSNRRLLKRMGKAVPALSPTKQFPCDLKNYKPRSDSVPDNVHKLRPGDIDVIGAMGDSLTAGTGISATSVPEEIFVAQRGRSWAGGGEKNWRHFLTLPNILKEFNPNLIGFATRAAYSTEWESQFNVAESGAISSQMPYMAKELVKRIKMDPRIDLNHHWKMITFMIGDNDFCSEVCVSNSYYKAIQKHKEDLYKVLRYLKDNLPRTIVNVVPPPRLDVLYKMKNLPLSCYLTQNVVCPCIRSLIYADKKRTMKDLMIKWQKSVVEIGTMPDWRSNNFAVIVQPFTLNLTFPKTSTGDLDYSFLGPDCFHFSEKGQARFANGLWNSMMEPSGHKNTDGSDNASKFHCPSEKHPYIYTSENS
ncbi:phospholipase B1, membrane-associated-like [Diabrotica undecimpunctata]|uniref:phospholipase B1, membrane-associated-like n=1 Tax=Diabrotica undecimpunctata TaxID=50387 RepID=UPI003B636FF8